MGRTRELYEEMYCLCSMPEDTYKSMKDNDEIKLISVHDKQMYKHYLLNEKWVEANEIYKLAKDERFQIELEIIYETKQRC